MSDIEKIEENEMKFKNLLNELSKQIYGDEYYIQEAILTYKFQGNKTYTFYRDNKSNSILDKYRWCQRPCESNMSLIHFTENGEIIGDMSESLAKQHGLEQITLNEFIHKFVKPILKANIENKVKGE